MEMKFDGEFKIALPCDQVYENLSDPSKFAPLLPAFNSVERKEDGTSVIKMSVGIGRIRGTATTELKLAQSDPPNSAQYVGQGKVMQGAFTVNAGFRLQEVSGGTLVQWQGQADLVGKILALAGGGMRGYAEKEINNVIGSLQAALVPGAVPAAAAAAASAAASHRAAADEGFFARLWRGIFGAPSVPASAPRATATPVSDKAVEPVVAEIAMPAEVKQAQDGARDRLNQVLNTKHAAAKLLRKEDARLIKGEGLYVDDFKSAGLLHLICVRSPYAHARIKSIDVSKAEALPGVVCTLTGEDIERMCDPLPQIGVGPSEKIKDYPLAVGKARYQGDPVAAVIAESVAIATDGAQLIDVDYEVLEPVIDVQDSLTDTNIIHEDMGTNMTFSDVFEYGDVDKAFAEAAHVVKIEKLYFHRTASTALECNASVATWSPRGDIDLFVNTIMSIPLIYLAPCLRVSIDKIRMRTHDIGGSFGNKITNYPYIALTAVASRKADGAPVKWVESRSEHMQAGGHGADRTFLDTEVALDKDGVITGLRSRHIDDCGAYPRYEPLGCAIWAQVLPGAYKHKNIRIQFDQAITNKGPAAPNRGYSRMQQLWFMERLVDICGHTLGIPADEMRLKNYIPETPYTTPNGCIYDSGDFSNMLATAKQVLGWDEWKRKQAEAKAEGRLIGIGIGTTLDSGTNNWGQARFVNPGAPFSGNTEGASIKLDLDGSIVVAIGSFPQGQGHETTAAQVVAEDLGIDPDIINVLAGFDTARNVHTVQSGTYASQFAVSGLSAVHGAAVKLKVELTRLAAWALQCSEAEVEFGMGETGAEARVPGTDKSINFWMLQNFVNYNSGELPEELRDITLSIRHVYVAPLDLPDVENKYGNLCLTYAMQLHIGVVEVNPDTFQTKILDYAVVDDCGKVVNHKIVEGQVHGATAHGIGAAIMEAVLHDAEGNVVHSSFTDYAPITINNMPDLKYQNIESPSPFTFNGAKGMGEGGGAPMHTLSAALQDALHEKGITIQSSHNSPMTMYDAFSVNPPQPVSVEHR